MIHRIKRLLIDGIPTGSYPAEITAFNAAIVGQSPGISSQKKEIAIC
jgi:hypothetical protein